MNHFLTHLTRSCQIWDTSGECTRPVRFGASLCKSEYERFVACAFFGKALHQLVSVMQRVLLAWNFETCAWDLQRVRAPAPPGAQLLVCGAAEMGYKQVVDGSSRTGIKPAWRIGAKLACGAHRPWVCTYCVCAPEAAERKRTSKTSIAYSVRNAGLWAWKPGR